MGELVTASDWQARNLQNIHDRLEFVQNVPEGVLFRSNQSDHELVVTKAGEYIYLIFYPELQAEIQTRMNINRPLALLAAYTQMLMLTLLWSDKPERVCILGLGGGRIPTLLHHYFPEAMIECIEIDDVVIDLAQRFFGVQADERLQVVHAEGRAYLASMPYGAQYDVIMVDAFDGVGDGPYALATREFYHLCMQHVTDDGVVAANILYIDSLREAKMETFKQSFPVSYIVTDPAQRNLLLLGCKKPLHCIAEAVKTAQKIEGSYQFDFRFSHHASQLKRLSGGSLLAKITGQVRVLSD